MLAVTQDGIAVADALVREVHFRWMIGSRTRRDHDVLARQQRRLAGRRLHFHVFASTNFASPKNTGTRLRS